MSDAPIGFWQMARARPEAVAVVAPDGKEVTAGDLARASHRLVHGLRARGLAAGSVIAIAMKNDIVFLELYLAAAEAGWYVVPINVRLTEPEVSYVLQNSGAKILVWDGSGAVAMRSASSVGLPHDRCFSTTNAFGCERYEDIKNGHPDVEPADRRLGGVMFYSSGTTGLPKAVKRRLPDEPPEKSLVALARLRLQSVGIASRDEATHLVIAPLYHSAALAWCSAHLQMGQRVVLTEEWSAEGMLDRIARYRVTGTLMVPTHFHRLLALPENVRKKYDVSSLRHVVHGGAPCPVETKKKMLDWWGPVIHEVYGAAEASTGTHVGPEEWLAHPGSVGRAGPHIRVLREDGSECASHEIGSVYFDNGRQSFEYLNDPIKTKEAHRGGFFTVGDLGYKDAAGYLFLCDRKSDVVISGGVNIYPAEVEAVLSDHPKVRDVAVFGIPDDEWGEQLKAVVELADGVRAGDDAAVELSIFCKGRLASFKCPKTIDFVTTLPRDPSGKLYKRRLREPYWEGRQRKI